MDMTLKQGKILMYGWGRLDAFSDLKKRVCSPMIRLSYQSKEILLIIFNSF